MSNKVSSQCTIASATGMSEAISLKRIAILGLSISSANLSTLTTGTAGALAVQVYDHVEEAYGYLKKADGTGFVGIDFSSESGALYGYTFEADLHPYAQIRLVAVDNLTDLATQAPATNVTLALHQSIV
jgi:hypothetical protein